MRYKDIAKIAEAFPGLFSLKDLLDMEAREFALWLREVRH